MSNSATNALEAVKLSLDIYQLVQNAANTFDICRLAFDLFNQNTIEVDLMFCITDTKQFQHFMTSIHFSAFIDTEKSERHYSRDIGKDNLIRKALIYRAVLSSADPGVRLIEGLPEIEEMKSWLLMPIISAKQNNLLGLLGVFRKTEGHFSLIERQYFNVLMETIAHFELRNMAIITTKQLERERTINESATSLLHELYNELGTIPVHVQIIAESLRESKAVYPPVVDQHLDDIDSEAEEIRNRTRIRVDEVKKSLFSKVEQFNLYDLLIQITHSMDLMGCDLKFDSDGKSFIVNCKRRDMEDAIRNIFHNGIYAMVDSPQKKINVQITNFADDNNRHWVKLSLADTGVGIEPEVINRIWDISYSTKDPAGGFGLYWTKHVVEDAGGEIIVTSQPGHGSEFQIILPLISKSS